MYLAGLSAIDPLTGRDVVAECIAAGGFYQTDSIGQPGSQGWAGGVAPTPGARCVFPSGGARGAGGAGAGAVSVNVNPQINTNVSPQISPVFTQQDQPTNSPVNAAPNMEQSRQTSAANPTQQAGGAAEPSLTELLRALRETSAPSGGSGGGSVVIPSYVPVPSTTSATDAGESVTLPTPFGPAGVPLDTFNKYAPWVMVAMISGAAYYMTRKQRARR